MLDAESHSVKVLIKADMLDYYNVSGCYVLKPWSYSIWEIIQGKGTLLIYILQRDLSGATMKSGSTRRSKRWALKMHISRCLCRKKSSSGRRITSRVSPRRSLGSHERASLGSVPKVMFELTL